MKELSTISLRRNYLPISYDKIPVFYTLKYHKFTTVTFYPSALHPNPHWLVLAGNSQRKMR